MLTLPPSVLRDLVVEIKHLEARHQLGNSLVRRLAQEL